MSAFGVALPDFDFFRQRMDHPDFSVELQGINDAEGVAALPDLGGSLGVGRHGNPSVHPMSCYEAICRSPHPKPLP